MNPLLENFRKRHRNQLWCLNNRVKLQINVKKSQITTRKGDRTKTAGKVINRKKVNGPWTHMIDKIKKTFRLTWSHFRNNCQKLQNKFLIHIKNANNQQTFKSIMMHNRTLSWSKSTSIHKWETLTMRHYKASAPLFPIHDRNIMMALYSQVIGDTRANLAKRLSVNKSIKSNKSLNKIMRTVLMLRLSWQSYTVKSRRQLLRCWIAINKSTTWTSNTNT